nr:HAD family hydrolase [uncultured Cohaesibacter sp.]
MNEMSADIKTDIAQKRFVLATDLDGTFLGGSDEDRKALYDWIEANRDSVGLVFVTGRDPEFIVDLTSREGVPRPDYVIGDIGTTIASVTPEGHVEPIPSLEHDIAAAWNDSGDRVRDALVDIKGLTLQPTGFRYRVSYDMEPELFDPSACSIVDAMGLDWIISADRFFDVLPKGFSKGPSLLKLIDYLGLDATRVLAAGDTLNDLSMLQCGVPAVAVGGAEEPLLEKVHFLDHVHVAKAIGAAGIAEAIGAFGLHPGMNIKV